MRLLRVFPSAERLINREQLYLREPGGVFGRHFRVAGAIVMFGRQFLAFGCVEVFDVRSRNRPGSLAIDHPVDDGDRRFREDAQRRRDDVDLVLRLGEREGRLVFPGQEHVAQAALDRKVSVEPRAPLSSTGTFL